jgi:hypothetical protein
VTRRGHLATGVRRRRRGRSRDRTRDLLGVSEAL